MFPFSTASSNVSKGDSRKKRRAATSNIASLVAASGNRKNCKLKPDVLESFEFDDAEIKRRKQFEIIPATSTATSTNNATIKVGDCVRAIKHSA